MACIYKNINIFYRANVDTCMLLNFSNTHIFASSGPISSNEGSLNSSSVGLLILGGNEALTLGQPVYFFSNVFFAVYIHLTTYFLYLLKTFISEPFRFV